MQVILLLERNYRSNLRMLIVDLDDTLYETKSMNHDVFIPAIAIMKAASRSQNEDDLRTLEHDLWRLPINDVFEKYNTADEVKKEFYKSISSIRSSELNISAYKDYSSLRSIPMNKVIVTTGILELQMAKIEALNIKNDFENIYVDDPRLIPRFSKLKIFTEILKTNRLSPDQCWVIGDNPDSEIFAGAALGMNTIQRITSEKRISVQAHFTIQNFSSLPNIII